MRCSTLSPGDPTGDNPNIPSGFHLSRSVRRPPTSRSTLPRFPKEKQEDPHATTNFRDAQGSISTTSTALDRDGSPQLYARDPANITQPGPKLLLGKDQANAAGCCRTVFPNDLPRKPRGARALIGDHRNDEKPARCTDAACFPEIPTTRSSTRSPPALMRRRRGKLFAEARKQGHLALSWMVLHDWVEADHRKPASLPRSCTRGGSSTDSRKVPYMPVEFSAAGLPAWPQYGTSSL